MIKGKKVLVKNQSVGDFEAYVWRDNGIYETVDVVLDMPENDDDEVATMTFSLTDIHIL